MTMTASSQMHVAAYQLTLLLNFWLEMGSVSGARTAGQYRVSTAGH